MILMTLEGLQQKKVRHSSLSAKINKPLPMQIRLIRKFILFPLKGKFPKLSKRTLYARF